MKPYHSDLIEDSFRYCTEITAGHYENFPVGSWLIPRKLRKYVHAIYAFARTADDFADENSYRDDERHLRLEEWEKRLDESIIGKPDHPVFIALKETISKFDIPAALLKDLIVAFKMDIVNNYFQDKSSLLTYCHYSANPVGRIVLLLFGYRDPELHKLSDFICTALQLTNFWQDIAVDLEKDRIYIPGKDMENFGYRIDELKTHTYNQAFIDLLTDEIEFTRGLFIQGYPLCNKVERPLSLELKAVWNGGMRILDKIVEDKCDIFHKRPVITRLDKIRIISRALTTG